ncbi:YceD family protein [Limnohabitans sp. MORI2]|uniref:YceD family protein n=1 Tax=Limnohabitans sp. MORI2 TaxID=1751150 RepID=UPI002490525E|nr:YceD family protein [Limnohabitans sp. MORI2]
MQKPKNLRSLDVKAFAKAQMRLEGETPVVEFERLAEDCVGDVTGQVIWSVEGAVQPDASGKDAIWLHLEAKANVPLTCQRCLHPVPVELLIEQDFRFVADEATAVAEDDESEEDLLVLEDHFDVLALIEDELLMALPLVPMHPTCLSEQAPTSKEEEAILAEAKPNPFAVLASLKTRKH